MARDDSIRGGDADGLAQLRRVRQTGSFRPDGGLRDAAGGAPLLGERLEARGGPTVDLRDPLVFYDTSSFGPAAVDAMSRMVGETQLVYGSDRPVVEPVSTGRDSRLQANAEHLLVPAGASA